MKIAIKIFITAIFALISQTASAQFEALLQPFTAKGGESLAKKSADSAITSAYLKGVATLGDTTSALNLPINISFDMAKGQSKGWVYFLSGKSRLTNTDTSVIIAIVKIPIFGFQVLPFDASMLSTFSSFFSTVLPDNWLDSDAMAAKIRDNSSYQSFEAAHPGAKSLFIPLSISLFPLNFPAESPLWQLTFRSQGAGANAAASLVCEVHAITGEIKCEEMTTSVQETALPYGSFAIIPNPVSDALRFTAPIELRGGIITISIFNSLGQLVFSTRAETSASESVFLPVSSLPAGSYRLLCEANGHNAGATFAVYK